ncbi:Por secretion system C-terminal sorting domain-containing protein [Lishizhenia tianjinensis]|uniref:Por secretion system C-terminal sorting domain-containing protein n=1 Tax=Lishizhenia tianjinensis TaxID=477690 RepID=A0A1I7AKZ0_9FLAO|nr:T9SS type A sorting domain-containing protein [Lishizhenia tianjinensis]SFT75649.1 Por secretion system C-terminal sorting domain-containing protein [Lishizhenia tianjinensis]
MAQQHFYISIPEPCHEDWGKMSKLEKGRHCQACTKTVYDFTNKNHEEIEQAFYETSDLCGRFTSTQLRQSYQLPHAQRFNLARFTAACFLVFGLSLFSYSCDLETPHFNLIDNLQEQYFMGKVLPPDSTYKVESHQDTIIEMAQKDSLATDTLNFQEINIHSAVHRVEREISFAGIPIKTIQPTVTREIKPIEPLKSSLEVFPNPSSDFFKLQFIPPMQDSSSSEIEIRIYDAAGRLLEDDSYPFLGGNFETILSLTGKEAGVYYLQVIYGREVLKTVLVKN